MHCDRRTGAKLQPVGFLRGRHADVELIEGADLLVAQLGQDDVRTSCDVVRVHDLAVLDQGQREVAVVRVVRDAVDEADASADNDQFALAELETLTDLTRRSLHLHLDVLAGLPAFLGHLGEELIHLRAQRPLPELALWPVDHRPLAADEVAARAVADDEALVDQYFQSLDGGRSSGVPLGGNLGLRGQAITRGQGPVCDLGTDLVRDALVEGPCPAADCHGRCLHARE